MKDQLPLPGFRDESQLYDTLETWEQFLADVKAMPESLERPQTILHAVCMISLKREELEAMPDNLPDVQGLIDPPGPFGNNLEKWEAFLTDMDEWPDCVLKRETINHAKQIIAMKKRKHPVKTAAGMLVACKVSGRLIGPDVEPAPIPGQELI